MERKLKERVVGAALLVLVGVLVIPWLLDGPVAVRDATAPLALPRAAAGTATTKTIVLNAGQSQPAQPTGQPDLPVPVPAPQTTTDAPRPANAQPVVAAPAAQPPPTPTPAVKRAVVPAPVTSDPAAGWAVQVGSFTSQGNAQKLAAQLVDLGYKSFVARQVVNERVMYRVRVGPQRSREDAAALAARLKAEKLPVRIVEHPG